MSKFTNKLSDIYNMSESQFLSHVVNFYIKDFMIGTEDIVKSSFLYSWSYSKKLVDDDTFKTYSISITNYLCCSVFKWENIPSNIRTQNKRLKLYFEIFDIKLAIEHIIRLYSSVKDNFSQFENLDINSEIYKLSVDDYISSLIKQTALSDIELDRALELNRIKKERDIKINDITK